jgi:hypothetical protein
MSTYGLPKSDREFVLDRLDRDHINDLAEQAKLALFIQNMAIELCYQPGDATWYSLIIAPVRGLAGAPGGGTGDNAAQSYIGNSPRLQETGHHTFIIVYAQRETVAWFKADDDFEWIASKLIDLPGSALAIAQLLKAIF